LWAGTSRALSIELRAYEAEKNEDVAEDEADLLRVGCREMRDALDNLVIAIEMGWDLEGVIDRAITVLKDTSRRRMKMLLKTKPICFELAAGK
jgi:hypothetical protein